MSLVHEQPCRQFSFHEIRMATDNFCEIVGQGGFGCVYRGAVHNGSTTTLVAVKRLTPDSKQGIGEFETEIQMLSKCRHSNLVNLVGYCNEHQEMILVYEYMSRGNLGNHLYGNQGPPLRWEQRLNICIGAARGLDYLHTGTGLSDRIIHLDVKSDNILLDHNWAAKIADLGLSKTGPANQPNSEVHVDNVGGTYDYVDPEFLHTRKYSRKVDVYSFGVVLLEVLSGTSAWGGHIIPKHKSNTHRAAWIQQHIHNQTLDQIIDSRIVSEIQPESVRRFVSTASNMLQLDPIKRPSMSSVVAQLESALKFQSSSPVDDEDDPFIGNTSRSISTPEVLVEPNVFGEPIGDNTTVQMGLDPTRVNRALAAYQRISHDNKKDDAYRYLIDLNARWGTAISTLCMIYNATGETLTCVTDRNRYGDTSPVRYPSRIQNGQWGAYMHRKTPMVPAGSVGAVVYRGKYSDNASCDRMITWSNRLQRITHGIAAYCEINEAGYFDFTDWEAIFNKAKYVGPEYKVTWKDCFTMVTIQGEATTVFVAIFTQVDVPQRSNMEELHL